MILTRIFGKVRNSTRLLILSSVLLVLIAILLGSSYAHEEADKSYREDISQHAVSIVYKIDSFFDEANNLASQVATMWYVPCKKSEYNLKKLVASSNVARSATILHNNNVYCSSVYKLGREDLDTSTFRKTITLLASNHITPNSPVVGYKLVKGDWAALIGINANVFSRILENDQYKDNLFFAIDNKLLNDSEKVFWLQSIEEANNILSVKSIKYPFKVMIKINSVSFWDYVYTRYIIFFILIATIALIETLYITLTSAKRDMKRAIAADEFIPYYQLVVTSSSYRWHGMEVLIRWQHPKLGLVEPIKFIPLAERSKLVVPMTRQLMIKVAHDLVPYIDVLPNPFVISFNISASHLYEPTLLVDCQNFLAKFPSNKIVLVLELTEGQLIEPSERLDRLFDTFHQIGVRVAIDDFGTGYSNLAYLQKLKIDKLKIDRMFVSMIYTTTEAQYLVDTIISLAKQLKLKLVAEGVETHEQLQYLTDHKVDYIQGFLFSRPAPIQEMIKDVLQPSSIVRSFQQFSIFNENI